MKQELFPEIADSGLRIDKYLSTENEQLSRSYIQKLLKSGLVLVDGKPVKASYQVEEGEVISLDIPEAVEPEIEPEDMDLDILYEDDYLLVINKPEGMLSVPGKGDVDSVYQRLSILYPEATGPIIVHRLDMATSGLLLAAKTKEAHQNLQAQFKNRTIQKRYIALLEGEVPQDEGEIRLPLCPDPLDRPRQIVSEEFGKPAFTRYRVLERTSGKTLIAFYPQTGRTHQLRVHAAHPLGLHCPILGDELYGRKAERLYLHAEYLAFTHPITSERIEIQKSPAFPRRSMP